MAANLDAQGKYAEAQPLYEQALAIRRRLLTDDHPHTAQGYNNLADNLAAQGKYAEARDRYLQAAGSFEAARLPAAFTGLERAAAMSRADPLVALAAAQVLLQASPGLGGLTEPGQDRGQGQQGVGPAHGGGAL